MFKMPKPEFTPEFKAFHSTQFIQHEVIACVESLDEAAEFSEALPEGFDTGFAVAFPGEKAQT